MCWTYLTVLVFSVFMGPNTLGPGQCVLIDDTTIVAESDCSEMLSGYSLAKVVVVLHGHFDDVAM